MNDKKLQHLQDITVSYLNEYYHGRHEVHTHDDGKVTYHVYIKTLSGIVDFVARFYHDYTGYDDDYVGEILYDDNGSELFTVIPDINYDLGTKFKLTLGTISWRK
jgi:hypothetical protein